MVRTAETADRMHSLAGRLEGLRATEVHAVHRADRQTFWATSNPGVLAVMNVRPVSRRREIVRDAVAALLASA